LSRAVLAGGRAFRAKPRLWAMEARPAEPRETFTLLNRGDCRFQLTVEGLSAEDFAEGFSGGPEAALISNVLESLLDLLAARSSLWRRAATLKEEEAATLKKETLLGVPEVPKAQEVVEEDAAGPERGAQLWEVMEESGLTVYEGLTPSSRNRVLDRRLDKGAVIRELYFQESRLQFELLRGRGPPTGFVNFDSWRGSPKLQKYPAEQICHLGTIAKEKEFFTQLFTVDMFDAHPPTLAGGWHRCITGRACGPAGFAEGIAKKVPLCAVFFCTDTRWDKHTDLSRGGNSAESYLFKAISAGIVEQLGIPTARMDYEGVGLSQGFAVPPVEDCPWPSMDAHFAVLRWCLERAEKLVVIGFGMGGSQMCCHMKMANGVCPSLSHDWPQRVFGLVTLCFGDRAPLLYRALGMEIMASGPEAGIQCFKNLCIPNLNVMCSKDQMTRKNYMDELIEMRPDHGLGAKNVLLEGGSKEMHGLQDKCTAEIVKWLEGTLRLHRMEGFCSLE